MKILRNLAFVCAALLLHPTAAAAADALPGVGSLIATPEDGGVVLSIPGRGGSPYRVTWLTNPYRLAVDIQGMRLGPAGSNVYLGDGLVTQVRAARQPGNIVRVVFDLRGPADLRAENRGNALRLVVVPRGRAAQVMPAAPAAQAPPAAMVPPFTLAPPVAVPTPRPLPPYPGYAMPYQAFNPQVRVTPVPITPPMTMATPVPLPPTPPTAPTAVPTPAAWPSPEAAWPSAAPGPVKPPSPFEDDPFSDEVEPPFKTVLGNRVWLGGGFLLNLNETFAAGRSNSIVNGVPALELGAEHLFTRNIGAALGMRMQGYSIQDADEQFSAVDRRYLRDELEGHFGVRARFDLAPGFEVYAQPQGVLRNVTVETRVLPGGATNPDPGAVVRSDFLVQSHRAYGGGLGLGAAYRFNDMFALVGGGDVNYLLGDYLLTPDPGAPTPPAIYPMLNFRGGLDARFTLSGFSASLGYKFAAFNNADRGYDQLWHGPALSVGVQY